MSEDNGKGGQETVPLGDLNQENAKVKINLGM